MQSTTIPIKKETKEKLKQFAKTKESWNDILNRLYENAISVNNAEILFSKNSLTLKESLEEIDKW